MSTTYKTIRGDTFARIALKVYGDDLEAERIRKANPGVANPPSIGTVLTIPRVPTHPVIKRRFTESSTPNEVTLSIEGKRFRYWNSLTIVRSMDAMDTLSISALFEPNNKEFRDAFRPFSFNEVEVNIGAKPLFTGTLMQPYPETMADRKTVSANAYSLPGVLNDCTAPATSYPIQYRPGTKLSTVVSDLVSPFGISVEFDANEGAAFETIAPRSTEKILDFIIGLAQQRGLLVSSTSSGALLFQKAIERGTPRETLDEGKPPLASIVPDFNAQGYFSDITALSLLIVGLDGGSYTVRNPHAGGIIRPHVFVPPDAFGAEVEEACKAKAARMFANVAVYSVFVPTWRDSKGRLWEPNTLVRVRAPGAMVYDFYTFIIRTVEFNKSGEEETAVLTLTFPEAFKGELPESLPWDL